ncbi:flagellar export protein FliJ [Heliophilum fasciatum]|uniref:Flagellar FliJ protein n=1 Tax=Heliophilum fasciatum TaxID=35700 RepID=A0A4R2RP56_9FIRM|nr:flagellar export protein FliJ [Heliophilum fasciatum]MCW2277941.1 flagellar FliJ protein [Heliophilum fasciatum]TCP64489.1 flagellar FliJ protein [Heliophilum fasciatum]
MKRFQFRLQTALMVKTHQEEMVKREMQVQQQALEQQETLLAEIRQHMDSAMQNVRNRSAVNIDVQERMMFVRYWQRMQAQEQRQLRQVDQEKQKLEAVRQRLIAAMQERKVLEKLREKHLTEYKKQMLEEEQIYLDELATMRHGRAELE